MTKQTKSKGEMSDGHHTFNELYEHRIALFVALVRSHPDISWRSQHHGDGTMYDNWFIAGMDLPTGPVTYHLPDSAWHKLGATKTLNRAPEWDGHTPQDVVNRITEWAQAL